MMFFSDKAEKVGPKIASKIGKELGISAPPFEAIVEGRFKAGSLGGYLGDVGKALFGGNVRPLLTVNLEVPASRPFELAARVIKAGTAVALGSLLYSTRLNKNISGTVTLEDAKMFGKSKFTGDGAADKLNASSELIKSVNAFVRTSYQVGDEKVSTERFLKIEPLPDGGSLLAINTLPKSKWFGLTSTFAAPAFLLIAQQIESLL